MSKFIRLTQVDQDGSEEKFFVNIDHISIVKEAPPTNANIQSIVHIRGRAYGMREPFQSVVDLLKTPSGP